MDFLAVVGREDAEVQLSGTEDAMKKGDFLIGTPAQVVEQIEEVQARGFDKLELMFLNFPEFRRL